MSPDEPLVSVLICTYNAERFITPALCSVVDQTYDNLEINILDNDSSDGTVERIREFADDRINLYESDQNLGPYDGLNYLMNRSEGEYLAIQDHDDIWHVDKVQIQVEALESSKEYVGCGGSSIKLFEGKDRVAIPDTDRVEDTSSVPHTTLMFRNDGFRYDSSVGYKTDLYFMEEVLCGVGKLLKIDKPLHISLVRSDNRNLSFEWTKGVPSNILDYYKRTGRIDRLAWGLLNTVLPATATQKLSLLLFDYSVAPVDQLAHDSFTESYIGYIKPYTEQTIET